MSIVVNQNQFCLHTKNTSYVFVTYLDKWLIHTYWGKRLKNHIDTTHFPKNRSVGRAGAFHAMLGSSFITDLQFEFSTVGGGDYRVPAFQAKYENGSTVSEFEYKDYKIYRGKKKLDGLPAVYCESEEECETLEVTLEDSLTGLQAVLIYNVFYDYDIITRSVRYINDAKEKITILSAQSACIDMLERDYKIMHFYGDWIRERQIEYVDVPRGIFKMDSKRGMSSHMQSPFMAIMDKNADEQKGDVYGFALVYSGSFEMCVEKNSVGVMRVTAGINTFDFNWELEKNATFQTPEVVMTYSDQGISLMSKRYHRIFRERLARGLHRDQERPIIINNWEATSYYFTEDKLIDIAKKGKEIGCELFVLDDGWFREDYLSGLGDWYPIKEKLPSGLEGLSKKIKESGMKFGLWVEPEMISPISNLYTEHPDWCLHAPERTRTQNRCQLVLDLSRDDVCEFVIDTFTEIIESTQVDYIKWDCNRNITETANQMQTHQFVLGLYRVMESLITRFPNVLFESCSGGGGRFDAGMLYYMPQTWTSDNTNPVDRLRIQYGTSMFFPPVSMAAHIGSSAKAGQVSFNKAMDFSAHVAMGGNFGLEFDLSKMSEEETKQAKGYIEFYKSIRSTIQFGDFYRLESPFGRDTAAWMFVDEKRAIFMFYQMLGMKSADIKQIRFAGLMEDAVYEYDNKQYFGEELMNIGFKVPLSADEHSGRCFVFDRVS